MIEKNIQQPTIYVDDISTQQINRTKKMMHWLIFGANQHGIPLNKYPNLTSERIEEIYNVSFN